MAIPPGRWVGYALIIAGLSLLYDTYTFLRTSWSPLHVPMYAPSELELGHLLIVGGLVFLLAPTLLHMLDNYAPDDSMKMGEGLAYESVELRRRRRLRGGLLPQAVAQRIAVHGARPSRRGRRSEKNARTPAAKAIDLPPCFRRLRADPAGRRLAF